MNRDEIVRLGESGRPWDFLPVAAQALRVAPDDVGLRVLAAANFARLGLRTAALEHLDKVERGAAAAVDQLRAATEGLPGDEVRSAVETARANAAVLIGRGVELGEALEKWCAANAGTRWFRASGGNVVRQRGETLELVGDHAGVAKRFAAQHFGGADPAQAPVRTVYIEGADPPWLLREIAAALPRKKDGSWVRLALVQADATELLDGLALADLRELLGQERLSVLVGRDTGGQLAEWMKQRGGTQLSGPVVPLMSVRTRVTPAVQAVLALAEQNQERECERLTREVRAKYAGRDRAWWAKRYASASGGGADPLRVLIPTCRYSTFIQHASRDLATALTRAGCRAELLIEPDDSSHLSTVAHLRRLAEFEPDLVVLINFTRTNLGALYPPEVPWVCWVQDAMPHQFSEAVGRAQGELDFLAGLLNTELFDSFGFPRERALHMPVVASGEKFHAGPVEPGLARRMECEVAVLTHHSETPEQFHARLLNEARADATTQRVLGLLYQRVLAIAGRAAEASAQGALAAAVAGAMREVTGREPVTEALVRILRLYASPLADRALRHETIAWAAEVCQRRGWRLHVYGRGWESHPVLRKYAKGEVGHGEELRAAYQCAAAHLHASITTLSHQRVMECALSGGLPLCRLTADAMSVVKSCAQRAAAVSGAAPVREDPEKAWYVAADSAELMAHTALLQRLGMAAEAEFGTGKRRVASLLSRPAMAPEQRPDWLLVDMAETTFVGGTGLERGIERALESPGWRSGMLAAIAGRVRERLTHDEFVRRLLTLVRGSLS